MGFDQLSPIAPACVRCLLLPCGKIKFAAFSEAVSRLQKEDHVQLSDVSSEDGSKRAMFSPATYPMGAIFLEFSTSDAPESSKRLAPFELYRRPLVVLGIADDSETYTREATDRSNDDDGDKLSSWNEILSNLKEEHSSALIHKILVFGGVGHTSTGTEQIVYVPAQEESPSTALKAIICNIVAGFLEELSFYARSVQALPNIETPTSQSMRASIEHRSDSVGRGASPKLSSGTSSPTTNTKDNIRSPYRASMPAHVLSPLTSEIQNGSTGSNTSSPVEGSRPATNFDDMSTDRPSSASENRHNRQISMQGFGSGTTSEKARNQAKGRLGIVVGSMYLLAGRWSEAIKELSDSASTAKWSNDHAWFAKALDNILVGLLMCGMAGIEVEIPHICYPGEKPPWSFRSNKAIEGNRVAAMRVLSQLLPDLTNQVLHYYGRAVTSSFTEKAAVPMLTYSESALRFARLLSILRMHYGALNEQTFKRITTNSTMKDVPIPSTIDSLATRAEIASIALKAVPAEGGEDILEPLDRLNIFAGIASVLSSLGYHRKKALILRELMTNLLPLLIQSRKDSAAEMGFHPAASLSSTELATQSLNISSVAQNLGNSEADVLSLLDSVCEIYGVVCSNISDKLSTKEGRSQRPSDLEAYLEAIFLQARRRGYGSPILKMNMLRLCINICEALPDLEGLLRYSGDLLATASAGLAPGPDSSDAYPSMSMEDQVRAFSTIVRAAGASKQLGDDQEAEYWDEFLIRDIEIVISPTSDPPIPRSKHELLNVDRAESEKKTGPFIYNPFAIKSTAKVTEPTLLLNSEVTFIVMLQNLFDVELDVEWLQLDTSTEAISAISRDFRIGPYRTQKLYLKGRPSALGPTKILGCTAKVRGCRPKSFLVFRSAWRPSEEAKIKFIGVEAGLQPMNEDGSKSVSTGVQRPLAITLPLNVIEDQPLVLLKYTTLTQSAIMVLVGQRRHFNVVLENTSKKEVDFLLVSCTDSTAGLLRSAVENKETSPSDVYESEYSAYHQPAFTLVQPNSSELKIAPESRITLTIEVFGKPGLHSGSVQITYSHLGVPRDQITDKFYTRQIVIPVVVTVNTSVDLIRAEILPYSNVITSSRLSQSQPNTPAIVSGSGEPTKRRLDDVLDELKRHQLGEDRCFLLLDFFNAWPRPLKVSLEANESEDPDDWNKAYEVEDTLQPGNSSRLLMIIPKVSLDNPYAPIPIINPANGRQFVLNANKASAEIERVGREFFWYKEAILKNLRATWSELGGTSGQISLRTMRMSSRMIELLKPDHLEVDITISGPPTDINKLSSSHYNLQVDVFVTVTIHVRNLGATPVHPILRVQPSLRNQAYNVALDLSHKVAFNGLLQRTIPTLEPGGSFEAGLGMVFMCAGEYEIGARVEELRLLGHAADAAKELDHDDRRVWYAKRPCLVDVEL